MDVAISFAVGFTVIAVMVFCAVALMLDLRRINLQARHHRERADYYRRDRARDDQTFADIVNAFRSDFDGR